MDYEEALAYYPAVIASGDVAAFVAPLTGGPAPDGPGPDGPAPDGPASGGPVTGRPGTGGGADEGVLWAAWQTVVGAADVALVPLVAGVRERLPELPLFGAAMQAAWDEPPTGDAWTRLNAFAALLTPSGVDLLRLGLATIGTALETFAEPEAHVPAAVEWFRHAGPQLLSATLHGRTYVNLGEIGELALRAGVREPGFSVPRWAFWRSRMAGLADQGLRPARDGLKIMRRYDKRVAAGF